MERRAEDVEVWHGSWVDTFHDGFCEGAWDGPFSDEKFDEAVTLTGTGARVHADRVVFVGATSGQERIYLLRRGEELFVSNSLPFVMVAADDGPDPAYVWYEQEMLDQSQLGIFRTRRSLPTLKGQVVMHEASRVVVTRDLGIQRVENPAPAVPGDFASYVGIIRSAMRGVFENAVDAGRRSRFVPLATLSLGYDANSLAALAVPLGCREGVTFDEDQPGRAGRGDDGSFVGERLGIDVKRFPRMTRPQPRPCPEAEFCVCPPGGDRTWLIAEDILPGRIFLSGRHGDIVLSPKWKPHSYNLGYSALNDLGGATMTEFRLRVGYLNFAPWFTGWQHMDAIREISFSEEMAPYRIGGNYDRPIPRRILEEAGVPREAFGQRKIGGAYEYIHTDRDLSEASRDDYVAWFREQTVPRRARARIRIQRPVEKAERRVRQHLDRLTGGRVQLAPLVPYRWRISARRGYLFHWAFERMRDRYRLPSR